jgi:selenocysteine lyase/cysteine desulfurase
VHTLESLRRHPSSLAPHYGRFRVAERLLLTGHSHQAWPDVARDAVLRAFDDAAALVDEKWARAFAQADAVRAGFRRLLGDSRGHLALAASTHDAVVRFLSALPLRARPRLVTTDAEFHTLRRQLARLAEEGLSVVSVAARPAATLVERLIAAVRASPAPPAAVLLSTVSFDAAHIVPGLPALQAACDAAEVSLLFDAYHHLGVVPFSVDEWGLENAFITGGGYKYCQLGEGNCFLRFPRHSTARPIVTGWFAEFGLLPRAPRQGQVPYAEGPDRFAGATYDPTSHYRAAAVFDFFAAQGLAPRLLREVSQHQVGRLAAAFDDLDLDPALARRDRSVPLPGLAGFLAIETPRAAELVAGLGARGVSADCRGHTLRLGPAPYLCDHQLDASMAAFSEVARALSSG